MFASKFSPPFDSSDLLNASMCRSKMLLIHCDNLFVHYFTKNSFKLGLYLFTSDQIYPTKLLLKSKVISRSVVTQINDKLRGEIIFV